jgi:hypothetical protein
MPATTIPGRIRDVLTVFKKDQVIDAAEQRALVELAKNDKGKLTTTGKKALVEIHNKETFTSATVKGRLTATLLDAGVPASSLAVARSSDLSAFERLSDKKKVDAMFKTNIEETTDVFGNPDQNITHELRAGFGLVDINPGRQLKGEAGEKASTMIADIKKRQKETLAEWAEYDRDAGRDRHPNSLEKPALSAIVKNGETYGYLLTYEDENGSSREVYDRSMNKIGDVTDIWSDA